MNDSILTSTKLALGITEEYEHFDAELIMHINAVFMILNQLGCGPKAGFRITDKTAVWTNYIPEGPVLDMVRNYMPTKVKLMFDTSTLTSPMIEVINKNVSEAEFRIQVSVDPEPKEE